jgi:hypothetical protein
MKNIYILLLAMLFGISATAQITINSTDFASAGDNILVSHATPSPLTDFTTTGTNQTWDFNYLSPTLQDTSQFLVVSTTAATYALYFINVAFNSNRSNIATTGAPIPTIPGIPITISNPFNFYYKSTSQYKQQGIGAEINGFPTPIAYTNKDILYNFPMNFSDADSSDSDWNIGLTGVGYYGYNQHRVNYIDGWGSLLTPYGTFNTLRVKTEIFGVDTVHIDTLGFGIAFPLPQANEYKWFGAGQLIPLLQINTTVNFGFETATTIIYRDSLRSLGVNEIADKKTISVYPNPAKELLVINYPFSGNENLMLNILDVYGREIKNMIATLTDQKISINISSLASGTYTVKVSSVKGENSFCRFVKMD